jgi:chromate reductase
MKIIGIAGSLRKASFNRAALRAAQALVPAGDTLDIFDIEGIPPFNQENEKSPPPKVVDLKAAVRAADAVLFVTPEYNFSIPGVLKNAIDWGSRPYGDSAWKRKPVAVMGASTGMLGSARAQYHLRQCFIFLDMPAVNQPEVLIANAADKFDDKGNLKDEKTKELIGKLLASLSALTKQVGRK